MTTTKQLQVRRLEKALEVAISTNNTKLAATLRDLLRVEYARAPKSSDLTDAVVTDIKSVRAITNPRKMAKKLKCELHDTRIELDSPEVIESKWQAFQQKRRVFARA